MKIDMNRKGDKICLTQKGYLQKVLQKFNIRSDIKSVSAPLAPYFKLAAIISPKSVEERDYMSHVTYANAVDSLIYVMVYTMSDFSHTIGMLSVYMHDPEKGHWEAVKWILQYIKGTVDVGLVFERNTRGKQLCTGYIDSDTLEILTSAGQQ